MDQLFRSKQRFPRVTMTLCLIMALLSSACGAPTATEPSPPNATYTPTVPDTSTTVPTTSIPQATDTPMRVQTLPPPNDDAEAPIRLANAIRNNADYMVMVEILARAGIHTISGTNGQPVQEVRNTPSVLMFSDYQAQNLAGEAHATMGTLGAELDALAPVTDIPPLSYLLTTYVLEAETFGGQFSRALMTNVSFDTPPQVIYPTIVIALFLSDVLSQDQTNAGGIQLISAKNTTSVSFKPIRIAYKMAPAGPCGAMTGALENVLERILSNVLGSFFGSIVASAAIRYGIDALGDLLSNAPIVRQIRQVLAVAAMVAQFGSLLRNWSVQLTSDGSTYHYAGGGGTPNNGTFTAIVDAGGTMRVPPAVQECAALARITIPEITGAEGSQVVWTPGAGWGIHATETNKESVVAADQTAKLNFDTTSETKLDHGNGTTIQHPVSMNVSIKRNDVEQIKGVIGQAVNDLIGIPGVGGLVQSVVGSGVDALADTLMNPQAQATITVESEMHPWESRFTQAGSCGGQITLDANSCAGLAGPWTLRVTCSGQINGSTTTTFAFDASQAIPPPVNVEWTLKGNELNGMPLQPGTQCTTGENPGCITVTKLADAPIYSVRIYGAGYDNTFEMGTDTGGADITLEWFGSAQLKLGPIIHSEGTTTAKTYMGNVGSSADSVDFTLVPRPDQPLCTQGQSGGNSSTQQSDSQPPPAEPDDGDDNPSPPAPTATN